MRRSHVVAAAVLGVVLLSASFPVAASAATRDDTVNPEIAEMLEEVPGGILLDPNHAVWPDLDMEVRAPQAVAGFAARAVGGCATGRICVYKGSSLTGLSVSWGTCGTLSVPSGFLVRSLANARSSGYAQARNSSGGVLATANAGGWSNVGGTSTTIRCVL